MEVKKNLTKMDKAAQGICNRIFFRIIRSVRVLKREDRMAVLMNKREKIVHSWPSSKKKNANYMRLL